jgi:hypothetical protein
MVLALKGKLAHNADSPGAASTPYSELVTVLTGMGHDRKLAIDALNKARSELEGGGGMTNKELEEKIFRRAVLILSGA